MIVASLMNLGMNVGVFLFPYSIISVRIEERLKNSMIRKQRPPYGENGCTGASVITRRFFNMKDRIKNV